MVALCLSFLELHRHKSESKSLLENLSAVPTRKRTTKPKRPERARHVQHENEIGKAIEALGNGKLESLYHSICAIDLDPHTPDSRHWGMGVF